MPILISPTTILLPGAQMIGIKHAQYDSTDVSLHDIEEYLDTNVSFSHVLVNVESSFIVKTDDDNCIKQR